MRTTRYAYLCLPLVEVVAACLDYVWKFVCLVRQFKRATMPIRI